MSFVLFAIACLLVSIGVGCRYIWDTYCDNPLDSYRVVKVEHPLYEVKYHVQREYRKSGWKTIGDSTYDIAEIYGSFEEAEKQYNYLVGITKIVTTVILP